MSEHKPEIGTKKIDIATKRLKDQGLTTGPSEELEKHLTEVMAINKDPVVAEKLKHCHKMVTALDEYLKTTCSPESELQEKIWNDHFTEPWDEIHQKGLIPFRVPYGMISGKYEGQFLRMIAELHQSKRILEIGLLTGYSAVSFAQSPYCEELIALELVPYMADFTKARITGTPVENKIRVMVGAASESLIKLKDEGKKFDLVFIDADKGGYINYYKYIMDNDLLEKTGVILCDNILWDSDPYTTKSTQAGKALFEFAEFVKSDDRVRQVICPVRDGVLMIKRKI